MTALLEQRARGRIAGTFTTTILVAGLVACGQPIGVNSTPSAPAASATRTIEPASPSPSPTIETTPSLLAFSENNCVNPPSSSARTSSLSDAFGSVVELPNGWTSIPLGASETESLALAAPSDYAYLPTRIGVLALMGRWPTGTDPEAVLKDWYTPSPNGNPDFAVTLIGSPTRCTVGSADAAYFEYSAKHSQAVAATLPDSPQGVHGFMVVFLHGNLGFGIRLEGTGGVDPRAVGVAKEILESWTWTKPIPSP